MKIVTGPKVNVGFELRSNDCTSRMLVVILVMKSQENRARMMHAKPMTHEDRDQCQERLAMFVTLSSKVSMLNSCL